ITEPMSSRPLPRPNELQSRLLKDVLAYASSVLEKAGLAHARLDASLLLAHVLGFSREQVILAPEKTLESIEFKEFFALVARRQQYEPVAYFTGKKEFWSLDFYVTCDTLIPRPDSETLIEAALKRVNRRTQAKPATLLDIGTGTGCLLIALLKELPEFCGMGV